MDREEPAGRVGPPRPDRGARSDQAPPPQRERLSQEQRYRFLASASRELATNLDYEATLVSLASRPLPFLGAWCIVDLLEGEDGIRRVAIVHPDPDKQQLARQLQSGWPPSRKDPFGIPTVMESLQPDLVPEIADDVLVVAARDDRNLRLLRELRMGSLITVPLVARGRLLGAITYVAPAAGRTFTDDDVALATDLAALSALATENARLHDLTGSARQDAELRRADAERLAALAGAINERLFITALRETDAAELSASAAEAASVFMMTLSHEIRTPLSAIVGYTDLLLRGHQGDLTEKQVVSLERVQLAVKQILRLVDQFLIYARVGAQREPVRLGQVDVAAVAREALALLEPTTVGKNLTLTGDFPAEGLVLATDGDKVRQILLNLLSNAIKFTDEGEVRLKAEASGGGVRFRVCDTGRGIPKKEQERIFEPFRQAEASGASRGGSGLGLPITRALVGLMGGEMSLISEPGRGSTFTVFLPARDKAAKSTRL